MKAPGVTGLIARLKIESHRVFQKFGEGTDRFRTVRQKKKKSQRKDEIDFTDFFKEWARLR